MKLYVVVREDLSPGAQMAQSLHAFREFVEHHQEVEREWYSTSNTIVILGVPGEGDLYGLIHTASDLNVKYSSFREPDMEDELTALAFEPGEKTSEMLKYLKLAGQFTG